VPYAKCVSREKKKSDIQTPPTSEKVKISSQSDRGPIFYLLPVPFCLSLVASPFFPIKHLEHHLTTIMSPTVSTNK
jgi:hypothetical protein